MEAVRILVGVDFSDASAVALERARALACAIGGRVVALHAADREPWSWTPERLGWLSALRLPPGEVVIRTGAPWLQIARHADEIRPVMVVVGSHGAGGFQPVTAGSTTMMLLTRVRVPVLVVPPHRLAPPTATDPSDPWRSGATPTAP